MWVLSTSVALGTLWISDAWISVAVDDALALSLTICFHK